MSLDVQAQDYFRRRTVVESGAAPATLPAWENTIVWYPHNTFTNAAGQYPDLSFVGTNVGVMTGPPEYISSSRGVYYCGNYATLAGGNFLNGLTSYSVSVWIDEASFVANAGIWAARGATIHGLVLSSPNPSNMHLYADSLRSTTTVTNSVPLIADRYVNYITTFTASNTMYIYRNGLLFASKNTATNASVSGQTDSMKLALDGYSGSRNFNGYLDDLVIWTIALSSNQAKAVFDFGHGGVVNIENSSGVAQTDFGVDFPCFSNTICFYPFTQFTNDSGKVVDESYVATNHATPGVGAACPTFVSSNEGCYFTADTVTGDTFPCDGVTALTMSVWCKMSNDVSFAGICGITNILGGVLIRSGFLCDSAPAFAMRADFRFSTSFYVSPTGLTTGEWVNFTTVWNGGYGSTNLYFYKNGILTASGSCGYHPFTQIGRLQLGVFINQAHKFNGNIDNFCLWNKALSTQEVYRVFTLGH